MERDDQALGADNHELERRVAALERENERLREKHREDVLWYHDLFAKFSEASGFPMPVYVDGLADQSCPRLVPLPVELPIYNRPIPLTGAIASAAKGDPAAAARPHGATADPRPDPRALAMKLNARTPVPAALAFSCGRRRKKGPVGVDGGDVGASAPKKKMKKDAAPGDAFVGN